MAWKNFSTVYLERGVLFRVLYRCTWSKENTEGKMEEREGGEHENLKAILKPSSLFPLLSPILSLPLPLPARTGGRILIQPRWLTDKPDGFDGCEVFRSRLSTIQRKLALSLSLSLGWPYFPPQAAALAEEMWWKFRIRYSTLVGSRAEEEEVFGREKSFSTGIFASELPMVRGELAFPEVFRPPLFFPPSIFLLAD